MTATERKPDIQQDYAFITMLRLTDTMAPWAIRVAATLGLADVISQDGATLEEVKQALADRGEQVDTETLARLLRYLVTIEIFDQEESTRRYRQTPLSELMAESNPVSMRDWWQLDSAMCRLDQTPMLIEEALRTGRPTYEELFGLDFWADLDREPQLAASFERAMAHKTRISIPSLMEAYDWAGVRDFVDVGGGHGLLLEAILRQATNAHGTVFDTAAGVATAKIHLAGSDVIDRAHFVAGSFFDAWPEGVDTYLLMNVLHNWSDDQSVEILRRGAKAIGRTGRILVIETVIGGAGDQRMLARLDMMMLLFCGGKERTRAQYDDLAARAGLTVRASHPTSFGLALMELGAAEERP